MAPESVAEADHRVSLDGKHGLEQWREFAVNSTARGGRVAHRFIKGPAAPSAPSAKGDSVMPVGADEALEGVLADWLFFWNDGRRMRYDVRQAAVGDARLPPITVEMFDKACAAVAVERASAASPTICDKA